MSTRTQTVFSFSSTQEPASESQRIALGAHCRVLVVDDSEDLRELISTVLRAQFKANVVGEAANGVEALEAVAELQPELVLMDVQMPRMNGISAAEIISSNYPDITVILMSGDDSLELRAQAAACGAHTFIHKPKFAAEIARVLTSGERAAVHAGA